VFAAGQPCTLTIPAGLPQLQATNILQWDDDSPVTLSPGASVNLSSISGNLATSGKGSMLRMVAVFGDDWAVLDLGGGRGRFPFVLTSSTLLYQDLRGLKRPQPALLALLASGWAPIYPCHVSPRDMRSRPIGTGPFKFVEFKPNEVIRVMKNRDYWKEDRPYLDGIEWTIIRDTATRNLAFVAGKADPSGCGMTTSSAPR
jgi:hypothetical protein